MTERTAARRETPPDAVPRLAVEGLSKTFGRSTVLKGVDLGVRGGEIHGLVGQNGSGKSTLVKLLTGLHRPDDGAQVRIDGRAVPQPITPAGISALGLTVVHQTLGLVPGHTVTENIRLGQLRGRGRGHLISWPREREQAALTLRSLHAEIDPDALVDRLHMGQRATVAVARALQSIVPGQGCVVLDESTQSLPREVLPDFYAALKRLAAAGTSILVVSHRLDEVLELADRVTVLRDGAVAAGGLGTAGLSEHDLAEVILGGQLVGYTARGAGPRRDTEPVIVARLRGVTGRTVAGLDLQLRAGEVVGVTGPTESGQEELPYLVSGARPEVATGEAEVEGQVLALAAADARTAQGAGICLVPADRAGAGIAGGLSAIDNLTVPRVKARSRRGWLRRHWQRVEFAQACSRLAITPPQPGLDASSFSGGNQQKLLLAKWLLNRPRLLVLHEPTQAVDVGARADILRAIGRLADEGAAVLLCSIEAQDLALVCDRVLVMHDGLVTRELSAPLSADDILRAT